MKTTLTQLFLVSLCALTLIGCVAPKPEALGLMARDNAIYVDEAGALEKKEERKDTVAVMVSQGDYDKYSSVARAIDSQLTEALSAFAFFEVVERSNLAALQQENIFAGEDLEEDLIAPADYMVTAKMNAVNVDRPIGTSFCTVSLSVDFRFYEMKSRRLIVTKNISKEYRSVEESSVMDKLALAGQECVKGFAQTLGSRFAPPARVVQTRGDCQVVRISIGTNYGLVKGVEVEFYEFVDNSAIIAGATRDKSVTGKGRVIEVDAQSAWVEVYDFKKVHVKRGDYVGILEDQSNRMRFQDVFQDVIRIN